MLTDLGCARSQEAECVAVGDGWVALATHRQFVRIITHTNIQRFTFR